ncbi:hypothetical protein I4U23_018665 [Adineta vaga]|nr:hypothetical protein I4U23_018665 [Adineta vaga]
MTKNRRFPFQRTQETISLNGFTANGKQLYSIIRQYASVSRQMDDHSQYIQIENIPNEDNSRLNEFVNNLKQEHDDCIIDQNNFTTLREHNIQHWKHVNSQWQKYYREELRKQQEIFTNLIKNSRG